MTQREEVLSYMMENGGITSMEAFRKLGITRLSARIYELRELGYPIENQRITKKHNGVTVSYDRYVLVK